VPGKPSATVTRLRSSLARAHQSPNPDHDRITKLRAELRTEMLAAHIRQVVDDLPPLTAAQRARLAALLRPDATEAQAA
jgi:hypothetical protein